MIKNRGIRHLRALVLQRKCCLHQSPMSLITVCWHIARTERGRFSLCTAWPICRNAGSLLRCLVWRVYCCCRERGWTLKLFRNPAAALNSHVRWRPRGCCKCAWTQMCVYGGGVGGGGVCDVCVCVCRCEKMCVCAVCECHVCVWCRERERELKTILQYSLGSVKTFLTTGPC